ncbi:MAG: polyamine aminopropyltransferase [Alicyclobacillus sp.]|nr:polyamine aminopropyltransferase [Alicyclobacillus sp.]
MELWFTERQTDNLTIGLRVTKTLHSEQTRYQGLDVVETAEYGRMLVLDGCIMTTDYDEFVYHEMLAHVALHTHPQPKSVLVVGGGDGGVIREVLKHPSVERAVLAEIDDRVIEASKRFFPQISSGFGDPRVDVQVTDGIQYVADHPGEFDVILVDSTDPVGPAVGLFSREFYRSVHRALREDGVFAAQTESPFVNRELIRRVFSDVRSVFAQTHLYLAYVPTYPTGMWSFTLGSKRHQPLPGPQAARTAGLRYYSPEVHRAAFVLPPFVQELIRG